MTHFHLPIEAVLGANHLAKRSEGHATPGGEVEYRQGIVGAEEEPLVNLRIVTEMQQHAEPIGQRQSGDIGVEMRVAFCEVLKRREEFLVQHQTIAAGMGRNDRGAFIQCHTESIWITDRLILADQAELVPDVAEERQLPFRQRSIERFVARISRVELLRVGSTFTNVAPASAQRWTSSTASRRCGLIETPARNSFGIGPRGLQHIVVADQKIRVCLIEPAILVVDPIHAEEHGLSEHDVTRAIR